MAGPTQDEWWEVHQSAVWGGGVGAFLRHGHLVEDGVICFGEAPPSSWSLWGKLYVTMPAHERLLRGGWQPNVWVQDTVRRLIDVPWRRWAEGNGAPPYVDERRWSRDPQWKRRDVSIPCMRLEPSRTVEVRLRKTGPRLTDPLQGVTTDVPNGVEGAREDLRYGAEGRRSSADRSPTVFSSAAKLLWAECGLDDGGYRWERVAVIG